MAAASTPASTGIPPKPVSVLFVCLGNICRSPMAEAVFRALTQSSTPTQHPCIARVDSCGTAAYHAGDQPDSRTLSVLETHAIISYTHAARKVRIPQDFTDFDYLLAMDEENIRGLRDLVKRAVKQKLLSGEEAKKIHLYGEFGGNSKDEEVADPYYGGRDGFETAYQQVARFAKGLLKHIEEHATTNK